MTCGSPGLWQEGGTCVPALRVSEQGSAMPAGAAWRREDTQVPSGRERGGQPSEPHPAPSGRSRPVQAAEGTLWGRVVTSGLGDRELSTLRQEATPQLESRSREDPRRGGSSQGWGRRGEGGLRESSAHPRAPTPRCRPASEDAKRHTEEEKEKTRFIQGHGTHSHPQSEKRNRTG